MRTVVKMREPSLDELLADPMMAAVMHHASTTPEGLRSLLRDARERLSQAKALEGERPGTAEP